MTFDHSAFQTQCVSSLTKIFADEPLHAEPFNQATALRNEQFSFQVAYYSNQLTKSIKVNITSPLREEIALYRVGLVPSELPFYPTYDDNVLRTTPGLYPDPLYPLEPGSTSEDFAAYPEQWRSIWVTVQLGEHVQPATYPIQIDIVTENDDMLSSSVFNLEVLDAQLPEQKLIHTEWFHTDGIANYYNIEVFSEPYWERVGQFVQMAVDHGMNMILTPLFTPPLDTKVGGERLTVQLIDVKRNGDQYQFSFDKLTRWVELCRDKGMTYFEFSHLFTQWGAKHTPKIIAEVDGVQQRIFGWETDATGKEYEHFLNQFLPQLKAYIYEHQLQDKVYLHVSDEPTLDHLEQYKKASTIIHKHMGEFPIIDALSDYSFYENDIVKHPIPASDHIEPFIENNVKPLWTYYCVGQSQLVSNRFFNMPSARNRIIGTQFFKFGIDGFLHWGYNFYNSQFSTRPIDPFRVTDADRSFPSGDPFIVYPGEDGPLASIRLKVFHDALQDLRALQLLESYIGKESVVQLLEEGLEQPLTFKQYPHEQSWLLAKREQINRMIQSHQ